MHKNTIKTLANEYLNAMSIVFLGKHFSIEAPD